MTKTFTKAQQKLIADAKASRSGRISVEHAWGRGRQGGRISTGNREWDAAMSLIEAGVMEVVVHHPVSTLAMGGGYTCWVGSRTLKLAAAYA